MTPPPADKKPKRRGNPNFVKGHKHGGRPKGLKNYIKKIGRCADFMESKGWAELEYLATCRGSKLQLGALQTIAAYGYGKPAETLELVKDGDQAMTVAEFLSSDNKKGNAVGSSRNDP